MAENLKVNDYHAIPVGFKKKRENINLYKKNNSRIPRHNPMSCIIVCDKIVYGQRQNKNKLMTELTLPQLQYHI